MSLLAEAVRIVVRECLALRPGERVTVVCDETTERLGAQFAAAFEAAGCDELVLFPSDSNPEQVGLLREALDG